MLLTEILDFTTHPHRSSHQEPAADQERGIGTGFVLWRHHSHIDNSPWSTSGHLEQVWLADSENKLCNWNNYGFSLSWNQWHWINNEDQKASIIQQCTESQKQREEQKGFLPQGFRVNQLSYHLGKNPNAFEELKDKCKTLSHIDDLEISPVANESGE